MTGWPFRNSTRFVAVPMKKGRPTRYKTGKCGHYFNHTTNCPYCYKAKLDAKK